MNDYEKQLELLNFLEVVNLGSHDKFLCKGLDGSIMIISARLRNYIKALYPGTQWQGEKEISETEWKKIAHELPLNHPDY